MTRQYTKREVHSTDLPITQPPVLSNDLDDDPREALAGEIVVTDEKELTHKAYMDELAFMAEPVKIILHRTREKFAPNAHDFYVQGKPLWITVDTPTTIPRCYLEIIARSQPFDVKTQVFEPAPGDDSGVFRNQIQRFQSSKYPFTVVEDKNPRGAAWLAKVMREG